MNMNKKFNPEDVDLNLNRRENLKIRIN